MAKEMVVCDGVRRLGLAVGCDGSVSDMGSGDEVCSGACCKFDGVCLQEERIFNGVGLDIRWGGFDFRWGVFEREGGFR
ncbi:unnamed protein product [Prunus armeniaca]